MKSWNKDEQCGEELGIGYEEIVGDQKLDEKEVKKIN